MSHSNSSLNSFANCMAKFEHSYILRTPISGPVSPHLRFGSMAHAVLDKAGMLRDEVADGVVDKDAYYPIIPSEVLYNDLKQEFQINNWEKYFTAVIKQVAEYEQDMINELGCATILREIKLHLSVEMLENLGVHGLKQPIVGIIDFLAMSDTHAFIIDYKFSANQKTQDDFDMNSQLPLYAMMVHLIYDIPLHNIKYGYIDIAKKSFGEPTILTNGTLSRSKEQNVSQEFYKAAVIAIHGENDPKFNCNPGGHYYDAYNNMALNKAAYLSTRWLDIEACSCITEDLFDAARMIDFMIDNKMKFLKKYDSYTCKNCEYLEKCKPWLTVGGFE